MIANETGTWLMTIKGGVTRFWYKNGFEDGGPQKYIKSNFKYVSFYSDGEVENSKNIPLIWDSEEQYDTWFGINQDGIGICKRIINGLLEKGIGCVNAETGEGYLFDPLTLQPLDLN